MTTKSHALQEFKAAGWVDAEGNFEDDMQKLICDQILELLELFGSHGHSGSSAPYAIELFSKLAAFKPLVPLTGEGWEWQEVSEGVLQNKRAGNVFKSADRFNGQAYDIDAVVFWEWCASPDIDGGKPYKSYFTSMDSAQPIEFPYTPTTIYKENLK